MGSNNKISTTTHTTEDDYLLREKQFDTRAIRGEYFQENWALSALVPPISLTVNYKHSIPGEAKPFRYSRHNNPSREILEKRLASLDDGKYGITFSSGLGTVFVVFQLLKPGDHILCIDDVYGGTKLCLQKLISRHGISFTFADLTDLKALENQIKSNTKLIWIESPTNPSMKIIDIENVCKLAKAKNPDIITAVDNTFLTSYFQKPLKLGADLSVYSLTKYMNGHSDVVMGAAVTNNENIYAELKFIQSIAGIIPSPFDCYLVDRGLKTLSIRMRQYMENGTIVAKFLENHPLVEKVLYPGLKSHPGHKILKKQSSGCSGMLSFYLKGSSEESKLLIRNLKYFILADSLGGLGSLVSIPALMSHDVISFNENQALGITHNLIRLSVGLESADDLVEDLSQAFSVILSSRQE